MTEFVDFKSNWKLYAVVMLGVGLGVADRFGVTVPKMAMWLFGILGRTDLRDAIRAQSKESADEIVELIDDIMAQVSIKQAAKVDPQLGVVGSAPIVPIEIKPLPPIT